MNIFDPLISGSLSVSGSGHISGDLTVLGTISATISGTTSNAISASHAASYLLTSSFQQFTGSYTTGSFTGSFGGDGTNLINIPASGVTGLNLTRIADGNVTASVSNINGLRVNSKTEITGSLIVTDGITGSIDYTNITNKPTLVSGSLQIDITGTSGYSTFSSSVSNSINILSSSIATTTNNLSTSIATTDLNQSNRLTSIENKTGSYATTGSNIFIGTQTHSGSIIPSVDNTYDLGSVTHQWRDVYISSGSLYIDGTKVLSSTAQELVITTDTGQSIKILEGSTDSIILQTADGDIELKSSGDGDILLDPTNGKIMLKGAVEILNGQKIQSSVGGTPVVFANDIVVSGSIDITGTIEGINLTDFSSSLNARLSTLEVSTGSLNSFTSSVIGRLNTIESTTSSLNSYTTSANSKFTSIETTTASLTSANSTQDGRLTSLENVTGSYATTGSNIFQGNQTITGSLFISENLVIAGSSSIQHITSSQLNIGDNIVTVNAQNPSIRFGGLAVIDSGSSPQLSGSILFDSVHNQWIFVHQNQGTITSSVLLMGPETYNNVGNEGYITTNRLVKSTGIEHLTNSNISDDGTTVTILSNAVVNGTFSATGTTLVSGSSQINHNSTTNYVANQHIDHSSVSISTGVGSGLTGGGDITTTRNLSIATGGVTNAMLAGSITNDKLTNSSITIAGTSTSLGGSISAATILSGTNVVSGSAQLSSTLLPLSGGTMTGPLSVNVASLNHITLANRFNLIGGSNFHISNNTFFDGGFKYVNGTDPASKLVITGAGSLVFDYAASGTINGPVTFSTVFSVSSAGVVSGSSFVRSGGTSSQFLKADGSVDSNTYLTSYTEVDTLATVTSRGNTTTGDINVNGNILMTGTATTTNQARTIDFTGFDKEGVTDFTDRAYIQHTTNTGGHAGSVLVISSENDADDGIAFLTNASSKLKHNSNNIATETWVTSQNYITSASVGNGTLTLAVSGTGLSGSSSFTANQSGNATFTVTSNATSANTVSTIVARDSSGNFSAGTITASLSGNATTATTLQTARTIGGVSFNGSANIDLPGVNTAGNQNTTGNAATATEVIRTVAAANEANLLYATIADNDFFRIRVGGASNAGFAEIATADDGSEPIHVRQYTGVFSSITRTATLLDASGNTSFPGVVSASGGSSTNWNTAFSWGNHASAGYAAASLSNNKTYTSTGNAAGSFLGGHYSSGGAEKPNSATFGAGKLKIAMLSSGNLGFSGSWNDVLWISSYNGGDVKSSHALVFDKYSSNVWVSDQDFDSASWGTGHLLLHSSNYTSFAPTLTGSGASGTWGINITGNAATLGGISASGFWQAGGSWSADFTSNGYVRQIGVTYTGGEFVILTNNAQISTLIDGSYFAGEQGGFYSMNSSNQFSSRVGFNRDGSGNASFNASIVPTTNGTLNLGSSSARWNTVFTSDLSMSNGIGDYTIVEGEEDLFIYNNKTNKVFKFLLQEVDPSIAPSKKVH